MQTHYFLAVPLPIELKQEIKKSFMIESLSFKRWVHEEDLHLTLVFLGACTKEQLVYIHKHFSSLMRGWEPFSLTLSSLGTFGNKEEPRIFWVGIEKQPLLHDLRDELFEICEEAGFTLEKRAFSPHITLARKWVGSDKYYKDLVKDLTLKREWNVDKIILYKSVLTEEPKYKEVDSFPLIGDRS
jgi:2'-5' RNA ligase